jgi:hypothetical protein
MSKSIFKIHLLVNNLFGIANFEEEEKKKLRGKFFHEIQGLGSSPFEMKWKESIS